MNQAFNHVFVQRKVTKLTTLAIFLFSGGVAEPQELTRSTVTAQVVSTITERFFIFDSYYMEEICSGQRCHIQGRKTESILQHVFTLSRQKFVHVG